VTLGAKGGRLLAGGTDAFPAWTIEPQEPPTASAAAEKRVFAEEAKPSGAKNPFSVAELHDRFRGTTQAPHVTPGGSAAAEKRVLAEEAKPSGARNPFSAAELQEGTAEPTTFSLGAAGGGA
jgi:hypothetical protein